MARVIDTAYDYYVKLVEAASDGTFPSAKDVPGFYGNYTACFYRLDKVADSQPCAAGMLIPNAAYTADVEGFSVQVAVHKEWLPDGITYEDARGVQKKHDLYARLGWSPEGFIRAIDELRCFKGFAERYAEELQDQVWQEAVGMLEATLVS